MTVTIKGNYNPLERAQTGIYSLDYALSSRGVLGIPLRIMTEIYGVTHVGKSTLAYYLASRVNQKGEVVLCDFEGMDVDHLKRAMEVAGFDGTVNIIEPINNKGKIRTDEEMLTELTDLMWDNNEITATILDSIGAIQTSEQRTTDIGEGFAGKRAISVGEFAIKMKTALIGRKTPAVAFVTNHAHAIMGGGYGHQSAGGKKLQHLVAVKLYIYNSAKDNIKSGDDVLALVQGGKVEKLRFGGKGGEFKFVIAPNYGVRPNLCALQDCVDLGLAERGAVVKIGDKSFGRISEVFQRDMDGDNDFFTPFYKALKEHYESIKPTGME